MYSWAEWVRSDGNCGPDSLTLLLSLSLLPTPALWLQNRATWSFLFRLRLFTWLAKNELTVANQFGVTFQLLCKDERMETETWAEYCDRMKNDTFGEAEWFTDTSLQAAAHMLEIDICVTTANGGTVFESKYQALHPSSTRPCFFLANSNNNHYWPFGLSAAPFQAPAVPAPCPAPTTPPTLAPTPSTQAMIGSASSLGAPATLPPSPTCVSAHAFDGISGFSVQSTANLAGPASADLSPNPDGGGPASTSGPGPAAAVHQAKQAAVTAAIPAAAARATHSSYHDRKAEGEEPR